MHVRLSIHGLSMTRVKGVSEALSWVFCHHGVAKAMKPPLTQKRMLVHPMDKRTPQENAGVVYQVLCKDCLCVYTGETERRYGVSEKEQQWDVRSLEQVKFTRATKKDSHAEVHPSAITDHITKNNHTIDWEGVKFLSRDCDTTKRGIWEDIATKKTEAHAMNHDGGLHQLSQYYTKLLSCDVREQH